MGQGGNMSFDYSYVDIAFKNGTVITINKNDEIAEAVGIKGNKIVFVGSNIELEKILDKETKVIDLNGKTLIPGFIDTHYHPILKGLFGDDEDSPIINTSLDNCKSIVDILMLVKKAASKRKPGEWISMMGYDQNNIFERRHITIEELDLASPRNPVQCMRACGHICIYNSMALQSIGVYCADDAKKYSENEIVIENGKLTGMVKDHTHFLIWSKVKYTEEQQIFAAMKSNDLLIRNGITSVHDAGEFSTLSYNIMQTLCKSREFKPREYMLIHNVFGKRFALEDNAHFLSLGLKTGIGDEYFRLGSCKFMIDGGTSGPSCATRDPYSHDPELAGIIGWSREETKEYIKIINDAGCQATAHAVGDLAVEYMVEGYEFAFKTNPRSEARHRIEHCAIVDQDLIERMAKLNICPSTNPGFIAWNGSNYTKYYSERMKYFIALRSMIDAGVMVSIGSDSPSGPIEPISVIDAAVNRIDRVTNEQTDIKQGISFLEAIKLYTINGAYSSYEENIKGSIEVGKLADIVILSTDVLKLKKENIRDLKVEMTMIDGIIEYKTSAM
jgi:predicted amidohydrolase YtcJ